MSPDTVLLTGQRDPRIKASLVRENPWFNFQISKISRTHWKSRKKAVPILLTLTGYLLTVDHQHSAQTLRILFCSGNWWNLLEKRQHIVGSYTVVIFYDFLSDLAFFTPGKFGKVWQKPFLWGCRKQCCEQPELEHPALSSSQGLCAQYWLGKCAVV